MNKRKIGIIGLGFVGNAIKVAMDDFDVCVIDADPQKSTHTYNDIHDCEAIFVCVPTPFGENGKCDTSILNTVLNNLVNYQGVIISKCTAPPLIYKELNQKYKNLVHAPEFLTAANAVNDYKNGTFLIIGGNNIDNIKKAEEIIIKGQPLVKSVIHCSIEEASLIKYSINSFLATKVIFMNELYFLSKTLNVDYEVITQGISLDPRIGKSHMQVPGPDNEFGFGGFCFPKDTSALLSIANEMNNSLSVLKSAVEKNSKLRLTKSK